MPRQTKPKRPNLIKLAETADTLLKATGGGWTWETAVDDVAGNAGLTDAERLELHALLEARGHHPPRPGDDVAAQPDPGDEGPYYDREQALNEPGDDLEAEAQATDAAIVAAFEREERLSAELEAAELEGHGTGGGSVNFRGGGDLLPNVDGETDGTGEALPPIEGPDDVAGQIVGPDGVTTIDVPRWATVSRTAVDPRDADMLRGAGIDPAEVPMVAEAEARANREILAFAIGPGITIPMRMVPGQGLTSDPYNPREHGSDTIAGPQHVTTLRWLDGRETPIPRGPVSMHSKNGRFWLEPGAPEEIRTTTTAGPGTGPERRSTRELLAEAEDTARRLRVRLLNECARERLDDGRPLPSEAMRSLEALHPLRKTLPPAAFDQVMATLVAAIEKDWGPIVT